MNKIICPICKTVFLCWSTSKSSAVPHHFKPKSDNTCLGVGKIVGIIKTGDMERESSKSGKSVHRCHHCGTCVFRESLKNVGKRRQDTVPIYKNLKIRYICTSCGRELGHLCLDCKY